MYIGFTVLAHVSVDSQHDTRPGHTYLSCLLAESSYSYFVPLRAGLLRPKQDLSQCCNRKSSQTLIRGAAEPCTLHLPPARSFEVLARTGLWIQTMRSSSWRLLPPHQVQVVWEPAQVVA